MGGRFPGPTHHSLLVFCGVLPLCAGSWFALMLLLFRLVLVLMVVLVILSMVVVLVLTLLLTGSSGNAAGHYGARGRHSSLRQSSTVEGSARHGDSRPSKNCSD